VKLIKALSTTPVLPAQNEAASAEPPDPQAALKANKATFFFRLVSLLPSDVAAASHVFQERELEKVNAFYLLKEAEVRNFSFCH